MLAVGVEFTKSDFLLIGGLWLFPTESALGLGNPHSFVGAHADGIRLKLGDHRQYSEQEYSPGIGGVVNGTTDIESDFPTGKVVRDLMSVKPERAKRSSFATTKASSSRQASIASGSPARFLFLPVKP